jgi:enterochelin esterase family protein
MRAGRLRTTFDVPIWTLGQRDVDVPLHHSLLIAHDGPEYAEFAALFQFLGAMSALGRIAPVSVALLQPVDRNETYSASALYGAALAREIVPALAAAVPHDRVVGMGASLGALAMLHAHRRHPKLFDALFLQSGSYFRQRWDKQESGFPRFRRINRFVGEVLAGRGAAPIPVAITVGTGEENLANNRAVAAALDEQGYDVRFATIRDAHNWTAWRDSLDPHLTELLA